jgi:DNA polymerase IV
MDILKGFSPYVEQNSIDEAWMDMTDMDRLYKKSFIDIAADIQHAIYVLEGLPCSVGISYNRFLSKMAAEMKKPNGVVSIDENNYKQLLWPLASEKMYGCGRVMSDRLRMFDILTIGDIAKTDPLFLRKKLGTSGEMLYYNANAKDYDETRLCRDEKIKSISRETTLITDTFDKDEIIKNMMPLLDDVAKQVREKNCLFTIIYIIIKFDDFTRMTRQRKVSCSSSRDVLLKNILTLVGETMFEKPVRLVGAGVSGLIDNNGMQMDLFENETDKKDGIYKIIDEKNSKYGSEIIKRGFYSNGDKR